jgi:hypothetical protein
MSCCRSLFERGRYVISAEGSHHRPFPGTVPPSWRRRYGRFHFHRICLHWMSKCRHCRTWRRLIPSSCGFLLRLFSVPRTKTTCLGTTGCNRRVPTGGHQKAIRGTGSPEGEQRASRKRDLSFPLFSYPLPFSHSSLFVSVNLPSPPLPLLSQQFLPILFYLPGIAMSLNRDLHRLIDSSIPSIDPTSLCNLRNTKLQFDNIQLNALK